MIKNSERPSFFRQLLEFTGKKPVNIYRPCGKDYNWFAYFDRKDACPPAKYLRRIRRGVGLRREAFYQFVENYLRDKFEE